MNFSKIRAIKFLGGRGLCSTSVALCILSATAIFFSLTGCNAEPQKPEKPLLESAKDEKPLHPEDAVEFNGHWYKIFRDEDKLLSWKKKKALCEEAGGYLACIESEAEQKFLAKLADELYLSLGATDEEEEGVWKWINGAEFEYTAWMSGQPNNYGGEEHYLATYDEGLWVDVANEGDAFWMPEGYICEWEK